MCVVSGDCVMGFCTSGIGGDLERPQVTRSARTQCSTSRRQVGICWFEWLVQ